MYAMTELTKTENPPSKPEHEEPLEAPTPHMPDYNATLYVFTRHQSRPIYQNDGHSHVALVLDVDVKQLPGLLQKFKTEYDEITPQRLRDRLANTGRIKILVSGYPAHGKEGGNCCERIIETIKSCCEDTPLWLQPSTTEQRHGFLEIYRGYHHEPTPRRRADNNPDQHLRDLGRFYRTYAFDGREETCHIERNPDGTVRVMRKKTPPASTWSSSRSESSLNPSLLGNEVKHEDGREDREFDREKDLKYKRHVLHLSIDMDHALSYLAKLINAQTLTAQHLEYDIGYGDYLVINQGTNKYFSLWSSVGYFLCCKRTKSVNCTTLVADLLQLSIPIRKRWLPPLKVGMNALSLTLPALVHFFTGIDLFGDIKEDTSETIASWCLVGITAATLVVSIFRCACDAPQCRGERCCRFSSDVALVVQVICFVILTGSYLSSKSGDRIRIDAPAGEVALLSLLATVISSIIAAFHLFVQRQNDWVLRPMDLYEQVLEAQKEQVLEAQKEKNTAPCRVVGLPLDTTPDSSCLTYFPYSGPPYSHSEDSEYEQEHKGSDDEEKRIAPPRRLS